uniref:Uncharacterized protein n=1 Tax=Steinernema glaseri TaxID=37863 RepID=A0A1I7YEL4_9BILA
MIQSEYKQYNIPCKAGFFNGPRENRLRINVNEAEFFNGQRENRLRINVAEGQKYSGIQKQGRSSSTSTQKWLKITGKQITNQQKADKILRCSSIPGWTILSLSEASSKNTSDPTWQGRDVEERSPSIRKKCTHPRKVL